MDYHSERTDWAGTMARALVAIDPLTASRPPSAEPQPVSLPTTMEEADALRDWASLTSPAPAAPATHDQLARHLEFMQAALPSRANDAETGRKRFAVYATILSGKSNEALAFMARRACETLEWFPSPKQCLDILAEYRPPAPPQSHALIACRQFTAARFDEWLAALRDGGEVGDVPERWQRIAVEQGVMRRLEDGTMVSRSLYNGPPRRPYQPPARKLPVPPSQSRHPVVAGASAGLVP